MGSSIEQRETDGNLGQPLLFAMPENGSDDQNQREKEDDLSLKIWVETKKLWHVVGLSIFSRLAAYSTNVVTQVFVGQLVNAPLAAFTLANNLGMASALETLCGQAFGAKSYQVLGIYLQRSWIVLFLCGFLLLPIYVFATPILKLIGQADDVAEMSGMVALYLIPLHFSFAFQFPLRKFLQCQLKTAVLAWISLVGLILNLFCCWLFINVLNFGILGAALSLDISWWFVGLGYYIYSVSCWCPLTWNGFSSEAFSGLWEFVKLSAASGVMRCLENWYYRILILLSGHLKNATVAIDALSVCMTINGWEMTIPIGTGVRVSNELGSGNEKAEIQVSVAQSTVIVLFICIVVVVLHSKIAYIVTTNINVVEARTSEKTIVKFGRLTYLIFSILYSNNGSGVNTLCYLLAITILLNSVQPVLSGVAIGSGWQAWVALINLFCYYVIGVPLGFLLSWLFHFGVRGIWGGMIFGGVGIQTVILAIITIRTDWEKEADKARLRVQKWSLPPPPSDISHEIQRH